MTIQSIKDKFLSAAYGADGKLSSRKITAFWMVAICTVVIFSEVLLAYLMVFGGINLTSYSISVLGELYSLIIALLTFIAAMFGVVTFGNVLGKKAEQPSSETTIIEKADIKQANINQAKEG